MSDDTYEMVIGEGRSLHIKRTFRTSLLARLREKAPDLVEQLRDIFIRADELEAQIDADDDGPGLRARAALRQLEAGHNLAITTTLEELEALHDFCAQMTDSVEGFEDPEGGPMNWARLEDDERRDVYDLHVHNKAKIHIFVNAYAEKAGLFTGTSSDDEGDDADASDTTTE